MRRSWRVRWAARIATAAVAGLSGSMLAAAVPASAAAVTVDPPLVAFNANGTGHLWLASPVYGGPNPDATHDTGLTMAPDTNPAIIEDYNPDGPSADLYMTAFQGSNNDLWIDGPSGNLDTGLKMRPGTSPAVFSGQVIEVCCTSNADSIGFVAYQSNTGELFAADIVAGPGGKPTVDEVDDQGAQLDPKSSPAIALAGQDIVIAYHGAGGHLGISDASAGTLTATSLGMSPGTSPSMIPVNGSGYEVAFNANSTNALWVYGSLGTGSLGLGMAAGTSPSIAQITQTTYEIAFQANTGHLWTTGSASSVHNGDTGQLMRPGTSPAIFGTHSSAGPNGYTVAYQTSTGDLGYYDEIAGQFDTKELGLNAGSSPAIAENGGIGAARIP